MAEQKVLRGNVTIWAAFPEARTDWSAPDASVIALDVADGLIVDISCAITDDSAESLNETDPATDDTQSVCDIASVETQTYRNYEAELDGFRNKTGTTDTPYYNTFYDLFNGVGREYWLVKRVDKAQGATVAAGDILSAFLFETDYGTDIAEDGGLTYFGARFKPQGEIYTNVSVVA
jgi:hypothetical protein